MGTIYGYTDSPVYPATISCLVKVEDGLSTITDVINEIKSSIVDVNEEIHDIRYPRRYGWSQEHRKKLRKFTNKRWSHHK